MVEKVSVNKFGDLKITLTNDFALDVFMDYSEGECWRFFDMSVRDQAHLVILGQGIEQAEETE
jgi:hypothetical protein